MLELANIDINSVVTTYNSLAGVISSSQGLSALSIILGLSGYSLRDLKGRVNLAKFIEKFKKELPEGTKNETQESILSNSLVELQDYIKNSENLDDNVFEKIGDIIINGIKNEDILTREYIKILKNLSWIDLSVLLESYLILKDLSIGTSCNQCSKHLKEKLHYPTELLVISINKLYNFNLILEQSSSWNILGKTSLGENICNLIKGEK